MQQQTQLARQTDRQYILIIGTPALDDGTIITELQVSFDVQLYADNKKTANSAVVEVYNLSRDTLRTLEQDYRYCSLAVGYKGLGTQPILTGNITKTVTQRSGPDQITKLYLGESYNSLQHSRLKTVVAPGKTLQDVIEEIRKQMPGVAKGSYVCDNLNSPVLYGYPLNGSPRAMLDRLCREQGWEYRVYLGGLHISNENGLTNKDQSEAVVISNKSGLIDVPYYESAAPQELPTAPRRASGVRFTALLNPSIEPGRLVKLESAVLPHLNGFYRVAAIRYTGDYRGNAWYMEVSATQVSNIELAL